MCRRSNQAAKRWWANGAAEAFQSSKANIPKERVAESDVNPLSTL